jgi:hypothetical protein
MGAIDIAIFLHRHLGQSDHRPLTDGHVDLYIHKAVIGLSCENQGEDGRNRGITASPPVSCR